MKIASDAEVETPFRNFAQGRQHVSEVLAVIHVVPVAMRGGHDVGDAVSRGHAAHRRSHRPRLGPVIDTRQYVAVNIDHLAQPSKSEWRKRIAKGAFTCSAPA